MVKRLVIVFLVISSVAKAQDIHFSQWMFSPLNLNPGETGAYEGDYRVVGNYRSQWGAVMEKQYKTFGMSYDQNFSIYGKSLSAGLQFNNDRSSIGNLMQNKLMFSLGSKKQVKKNYYSIGVQAGMLHKGLDPNEFSYPNQWDNSIGEFNGQGGLSNMESFTKFNDYSMDVNIGVGWARKVNDKFFPELGAAFFHLNTPEESFLNDSASFSLRQVYNAKLNYTINEKYSFSPNVLWMHQNNAQEVIVGALLFMKIKEKKAKVNEVFGGANMRAGFNRNYDALNLIMGARREEWQVGLSYDVNVSSLSSLTHYRGAFELSVIYIPQSTEPKIYNVPCDRY